MRAFIAILLIIYLVGVGVVLAPTIQTKWNTGTASELFGSISQELPRAVAWPAAVYHSMTDARAEKP